jgi:EAL domain-containing protein (putative c-di-GMP-specific phosphodiesterase class I)
MVANQGCTEVQGFYYSVPLTAEDVPQFIEKLKHQNES